MTLRVAVIGCGFQGRLHVKYLSRLDDVEVVAVADIDQDRLTEIGKNFDVPRQFTDYRELLASSGFDLVTICTMPIHHAPMTIAAFEAGAHVLCEKPLALNAEEGAAMVQAGRRAGKILAVGYNMRYTPNAQVISKFIESGGFGRPIYTKAWAKASQVPWWGEHYRKEISGGGALAATAVHFLDLALYFAGFPEPLTASASAARVFPRKRGDTAPDERAAGLFTVEDIISAHVRFKNGFWLNLEGSWIDNQPSKGGQASWDYSLDSIGEAAQVWFDPLAIRTESADGTIEDVLPADAASDVSFTRSVAAMLADVVASIQNGEEPLVTGDQALTVQHIVDAIYASAALGREVEVAGNA